MISPNGARVVNYALETKVNADLELVTNRLYLGGNLLYEPETTRGDLGVWSQESTLGQSFANRQSVKSVESAPDARTTGPLRLTTRIEVALRT